MKKLSIIAFISVLALIASNVFSYYNSYKWHIAAYQSNISKSIQVCSRLMSREINEIVLVVDKNLVREKETGTHLASLLSDSEILQKDYLREIRISKIGGTSVLKKSQTGKFLLESTDSSLTLPALGLTIDEENDQILLAQQILLDKKGLLITIELVVDQQLFLKSFLDICAFSDSHFYGIVDQNGKALFKAIKAGAVIPHLDYETTKGLSGKEVALTHNIDLGNSSIKVLSVFHTLLDSDNQSYLVFSYPTKNLTRSIVQNAMVYGVISIIIIALFLIFLTYGIRNKTLKKERLQKSEMALTKVLHYLPTGIVLMDENRRVRQVNRAAVKLFQLEDEDFILDQMFNENLLFSKFKIKDKYQVSTNGMRYIVIDSTNQERVIFNDKIPFFLQNEEFIMQSYHELTTYLQPTEKTIQGFKSGFVTNISHELRTPLNGILGMLEMLVKSKSIPNREMEITLLAKRSTETLMGLINDILDYSRLEVGKLEVESMPFNLKEEVDSLIKEFLPEARDKKIILTTRFEEPLPVDFIGDPMRFRQVLSNLLNNAIKFTPFGTIQIATFRTKALNGGRAIKFCIKDSGIGIKPDKLETIFEPFSQADQSLSRNYGGTGLGTTISKHLVLLMGGEISAKSPSDLSVDPNYPGAEICFTLPLKTRKYSKKLNFTGILSFAQLKALVISDDPLQVQVVTRNFIALGVDFKILPPSKETLDLLKKRESIHLVVIDHRYDFNGLDFLDVMHNHKLHDEYLIVLQSSDYQASNTTIAHRLGADVFLRKPIPLAILREFLLNNFPDLVAREKEAVLSVPSDLRIMVIEDNLLNQKVIRNLIKKIGYDSTVVISPEEALEVLNDCEFDLVLVDFYILQSAELNVVSQIKGNNFKCPVVVMASPFDLNDETRNAMTHMGVDDFLLKPFDMQLVSDVLFRMAP
jgi:signal transduction histidine kinase/CheY-like chemotaxis protein